MNSDITLKTVWTVSVFRFIAWSIETCYKLLYKWLSNKLALNKLFQRKNLINVGDFFPRKVRLREKT